ncbi:hypothetical protein JTE90_003960 [Oedothorax gibbosus]|uniref:Uncharacterized protein n=1 Tax=Oedothorax gibbosus TaxID=931172 RepID=A0AAV6UX41_9ARAC|nr:hypothetical protein JTE90_003960 [Oedothorax gibbosus]
MNSAGDCIVRILFPKRHPPDDTAIRPLIPVTSCQQSVYERHVENKIFSSSHKWPSKSSSEWKKRRDLISDLIKLGLPLETGGRKMQKGLAAIGGRLGVVRIKHRD